MTQLKEWDDSVNNIIYSVEDICGHFKFREYSEYADLIENCFPNKDKVSLREVIIYLPIHLVNEHKYENITAFQTANDIAEMIEDEVKPLFVLGF